MQDIVTFKDIWPAIEPIATALYQNKFKALIIPLSIWGIIKYIEYRIEKWKKDLRDENKKRES